MEGKTIENTLDMGQGYTLLKFDDGTYALAHIIEPELSAEELEDFIGTKATTKEKGKKEVKEDKKPTKEEKKSKKEEKEDSLDWEGLDKMDHDELTELCKENDLNTDPDDFEDDEDDILKFKTAIAEECGIDIPESPAKDDDYTWDDLKAMDYDELKELVEEEDLKTDADDFDEDTEEDKFRRAIAKELEIEAPAKKKPGK